MRKNILIIGGSKGIGSSLVNLLEKDHNLIVANRSNEGLESSNIKYIKFDALEGTIPKDELPEHIDGFVYCPGSINLRPFKGLRPQNFSDDFNINVLGAITSLQSVLDLLLKSEKASVVFYSTVAVQTGMPFHSSVASSKGAIEGLTRSLAAEFAPKIRFNTIAPSITDTPLSNKFLNSEIKIDKAKERHPLKEIGSSTDIAELTHFLLSDKSKWMTGQIIHLDGGIGDLKVN